MKEKGEIPVNLQDLLISLNAKKSGYYYLVTCPECGHHEAYLYISDIEKYQKGEIDKIPVRCNRQNKCGVTTYINDLDSLEINELPQVDEGDFVTKDAIEKTQELVRNKCNTCAYPDEFDWRGIPFSVLVNHKIVYLEHGWLSWMKTCGKNAFPERFTSNENYTKRNIVIPCYGYDGTIERVLLRARDAQIFPKELTMVFKQESTPVWNKPALLKESAEIIFVTEGVPDALSVYTYLEDKRRQLIEKADEFEEDFSSIYTNSIYNHVEVVALPGVKNWRKMLEEILATKSQKKKFVICFDNDEAGQKSYEQMESEFKNRSILYGKFNLGQFKDMNDYLVGDKDAFYKEMTNTLERMKIRKKLKFKKVQKTKKTNRKVLRRTNDIGYHTSKEFLEYANIPAPYPKNSRPSGFRFAH